ncbi:MAG TPA: hypothetical protein VM243_06585 [Phycisphaerae bacterium]|nr:hypothetical protein [Phycisphaerae bacterium]
MGSSRLRSRYGLIRLGCLALTAATGVSTPSVLAVDSCPFACGHVDGNGVIEPADFDEFASCMGQVPGAARELVKLSRHEEWWVRLYAGQIMRQHAAFRQSELMELLGRDDHAMVRQVVSAAD